MFENTLPNIDITKALEERHLERVLLENCHMLGLSRFNPDHVVSVQVLKERLRDVLREED